MIISGLDGNKIYKKEEVEEWIRERLEIEVHLDKVWKVKTNSNKFLLGAQCDKEGTKEEILKSKKKLGNQKIFIEEDFTWKERRNKEILRGKAREMRKDGKEAIVIRKERYERKKGHGHGVKKRKSGFSTRSTSSGNEGRERTNNERGGKNEEVRKEGKGRVTAVF